MNKVVVIFITILISSEASQNIDPRYSTVSKVNLYSNLNRHLHNLSITLFTSLKFGKNLTNMNKTNILIKMADNLINLSERKFKMYRVIHNTTKIETDNIAIKALFNLTRVIEEIFKEEHYFLRNNKFLRNNSLIEFYEAVVSNSNWLEKSLKDWENAENNTNIINRRWESVKAFRRKYEEKNQENINEHTSSKYTQHQKTINEIRRRRKNELLFWRAPNKTDNPTRRIFMSELTKIRKYPFMTSLHLMGEFVCAGSLISKDLVLTAASCLQLAFKNSNFLKNSGAVSIRAGSDYANKNGQMISIREIFFHPEYDPVYLSSNLAIGRLESSLNLRDSMSYMRRIQYDRKKRAVVEKTVITMLGWGDQDNINPYNGTLTRAHLETYNLDACKNIYSSRYVTETDFCAGFTEVGSGACNRDVGGPGFIGSYLVGVISFGPPVCGTPNGPTVFTKIGDYAPWIDSVYAKVSNEPRPKMSLKTRTTLNKKNGAKFHQLKPKKSTLQLLIDIFKGLRFKLFNNFNDVVPEYDDFFAVTQTTTADIPREYSDKSFTASPNDFLYEYKEEDDFWGKTDHDILNNELVNKSVLSHPEGNAILSFLQTTSTTKVTAEYDYEKPFEAPSEPAEDNTVIVGDYPTSSTMLPPKIMQELEHIREFLEPFYTTRSTTPFYPHKFLKTKIDRDVTRFSKKDRTVAVSVTKPLSSSEQEMKDFVEIQFPGDTDIDRDASEFLNEFSHKSLEEALKMIDESTNEVPDKPISAENQLYEKRRLTGATKARKAVKKKHKTKHQNLDGSSKIVRTDFKLQSLRNNELKNREGKHVQGMIFTALKQNMRDRDLAHYQASDENNWDWNVEDSRRILNYINI